MMMEPFYVRFPAIAEKETRCVIIPKGRDIPAGEYFMAESYCNDRKCDCRRVFINVLHEDGIMATIGYGWEDLKFYEKWIGDKSLAKNMKGPTLEVNGVHTKHSGKLLALFKEHMLTDPVFMERLQRHYKMFKGKR